ncbi:hypothetical protein K7432_008828 [Basidiobolus ranarum]|uniref:Uncharacterized protein n=1 Tax=Basidiobolus ranarum TaxID=34480 RepID=A0ABR2VXZ3_9FUNG
MGDNRHAPYGPSKDMIGTGYSVGYTANNSQYTITMALRLDPLGKILTEFNDFKWLNPEPGGE